MQVIPIQAVPVQVVKTVVANQNCQIFLKQTPRGMFFDLNVNGTDVVDTVPCQDANMLVCIQYTGFQGNFFFIDTQGNSDPEFAGLNSRYYLVYITAEENDLVNFA